jgi:hypothetical protein
MPFMKLKMPSQLLGMISTITQVILLKLDLNFQLLDMLTLLNKK